MDDFDIVSYLMGKKSGGGGTKITRVDLERRSSSSAIIVLTDEPSRNVIGVVSTSNNESYNIVPYQANWGWGATVTTPTGGLVKDQDVHCAYYYYD